MKDLFDYTKERLLKHDEFKMNRDLLRGEIREIMQEIILPGLAGTDFFENNAFLGGTAIRMLYGLKRYSEDLDFTMKEDKIKEFSWGKYTNSIVEYGKSLGVTFQCEEDADKHGNKIVRIRSDSILEMINGKNIIPKMYTRSNQREKIEVKLETNFSINAFNDEMKIADFFGKSEIRILDISSLFAGKINAVLTREQTNLETHKKERIDKGRDWYDLVWYINKQVKPNYNFLSKKISYKGPFEGKIIKADAKWVKDELFRRLESLDYNKINSDITLITLKENRITLTKDILTEKINMLG